MAMDASEITQLIKEAFPDAVVTIKDLAGDGDHYSGLPRVRQHQMVYAALKGKMGGELHALALQTEVPDHT